ncbi:hypothetical protein AKJ45_01780 [candidate division MSBL1 archaeon SCGC-AAA261F19]|uniref:DNA-directed DNA polymerase n=2 Tax=candidate division MSBL1 TaxID=215777 RepID=A0A133VAG1_9EURY|nr:hypothetical protein AKJ43_02915 [candidate division MSBL1 archaeon SCGC-AAA261D19]KXB03367.1 hypothetical protein AKJ45_01780 [candidate division MSBL1 archaeon SCGC-AAA261F19]
MKVDKWVTIPPYLKDGIDPLKRSYPSEINLIVFDVETEAGLPYLLTFYDGNKPTYIKVNPKTILDEFLKYLNENCSKNQTNLVYAHNLQFDLTAILNQYENELFQYLEPLKLEHPLGIFTTIYSQKTWFSQVKLKNCAYVKLIDTGSFFRGSLYKLSRQLNLDHKKRPRPDFVTEGRKPKNREELQKLYNYCRAEILSTYDLAEYILEMHEEYDTYVTMSAPQFASKVFKKHFLNQKIPQIPEKVRWLAERSIHGGRSDTFVECPILIPDVHYYDYNSFYPWAMTKLPPITNGEWEETDDFVDEYEGFYQVSGYVPKCKHSIILKNAGGMTYANDEYVRKAPLSSYELGEALNHDEIEIAEIKGYIWKPSEDAENPFKDYVEKFYELKQKTRKNDPRYQNNKLLLNSLYGKTYQTNRKTDYKEEPRYRWDHKTNSLKRNEIKYKAGGIYLPHIGSWITSMCRAELHDALHKYDGIDCATDSFKTKRNDVPTGEGLGELDHEYTGMLLLIRPKLYLMFSPDVQEEVMCDYGGDLRGWLDVNLSMLEEAGSIRELVPKFALHGFWGSPVQLLRLYLEKKNEYLVEHMNKIRESIRQGRQPRKMEERLRSIRIDWTKEVGLCGWKKGEAIKEWGMCTGACSKCPYAQEF